MTGELRVEPPGFRAGPHDHLVLRQKHHTLVFSDPRQFGRIRFHRGIEPPAWWRDLPPALTSSAFTLPRMRDYLARHARAPIKAVLLAQAGFPGVGNWMADEILWRSNLHPQRLTGRVGAGELAQLWRVVRFVCRNALRIVAKDY